MLLSRYHGFFDLYQTRLSDSLTTSVLYPSTLGHKPRLEPNTRPQASQAGTITSPSPRLILKYLMHHSPLLMSSGKPAAHRMVWQATKPLLPSTTTTPPHGTDVISTRPPPTYCLSPQVPRPKRKHARPRRHRAQLTPNSTYHLAGRKAGRLAVTCRKRSQNQNQRHRHSRQASQGHRLGRAPHHQTWW